MDNRIEVILECIDKNILKKEIKTFLELGYKIIGREEFNIKPIDIYTPEIKNKILYQITLYKLD